MNSDTVSAFTSGEVFSDWNSMDTDQKINLLTNPSSEIITKLTEFLKELNKPSERVTDMRESRNDALIELLLRGDSSFDEKLIIIDRIDDGIREAEAAKDKGAHLNIKALAVVGGILSIVIGGVVVTKNKKAGTALIAAGSTALLGAGASDTKTGKALIEYLSDTPSNDVIEI